MVNSPFCISIMGLVREYKHMDTWSDNGNLITSNPTDLGEDCLLLIKTYLGFLATDVKLLNTTSNIIGLGAWI
jgi:hypothetical protein